MSPRIVMTTRPYNFGAGPAMLPESVLREVQDELLNWQGTGMSVMEIGHRTEIFRALMNQMDDDLRGLLSIPPEYDILFLGGAARTQFAMVPLNFLKKHEKAAYFVTGLWSSLAFDEACKLRQAYRVAEDWLLQDNTAYLYYTPNETVNGIRVNAIPKFGDIPVVADMTSCLLSEPIQISDYGLIFAGAQKNIANSGLTIVIIRRDLLAKQREEPLATMLDYRVHAEHKSLYATPPTFNCYLAQKMFSWVKAQGGVEALYAINCKKAARLYDYIDASSYYHCAVKPNERSLMNVCFSIIRPELESEFVRCANQNGLYALQGHRTVGGLRASLYNAMPLAGVDALIAFMHKFSEEHPL